MLLLLLLFFFILILFLLLRLLVLVLTVAVLLVVLLLILLRQRFGDFTQEFQSLLLIGQCVDHPGLAQAAGRGSRMVHDPRSQLNRLLQ